MKIKKLKLFTNHFDAEFKFYSETLGFDLLAQSINSFTVKIGWSELTFERSATEHKYHYCFLIPANQLNNALEWMEKRTEIIVIENGRKTQNWAFWNADSFYFYDASGSIAEFIVRHDLENTIHGDFDLSKVLGINEMGVPTKDIKKINNHLEQELHTKFWTGDLSRFGTNGSHEGVWLLPNYALKDIWFPTQLKITPEPFDAIIENSGKEYKLEYRNEQFTTKQCNI